MIRRKPFETASKATAAQRDAIEPLCQCFTRRSRSRKAEWLLFPDCVIEGPLSFDLAYAADAGAKKGIGGSVVGAADVMVFPCLLAANLTVKAIMYTADCRFGGVLRGTSAPVVFMSRADSVETRLHSLALALRIIDREEATP